MGGGGQRERDIELEGKTDRDTDWERKGGGVERKRQTENVYSLKNQLNY